MKYKSIINYKIRLVCADLQFIFIFCIVLAKVLFAKVSLYQFRGVSGNTFYLHFGTFKNLS